MDSIFTADNQIAPTRDRRERSGIRAVLYKTCSGISAPLRYSRRRAARLMPKAPVWFLQVRRAAARAGIAVILSDNTSLQAHYLPAADQAKQQRLNMWAGRTMACQTSIALQCLLCPMCPAFL